MAYTAKQIIRYLNTVGSSYCEHSRQQGKQAQSAAATVHIVGS